MSDNESQHGRVYLTAAQMRDHEQAAIGSGAATGQELMERAGRGVVEAIFEAWPALAAAPFRALVICGPGNNGGDGFVIARLLKGWGWEVEVILHGDPDNLPPDARANYLRWCEMGAVGPLSEDGLPATRDVALIVDALFGTGLTRAVSNGAPGRALRDIARCRADEGGPRVVAVDIPSGLCADSGRVLIPEGHDASSGDAACGGADLTVSFHAAKLGHVLAQGPGLCGALSICDIGLTQDMGEDAAASVRAVGRPDAAAIAKAEGGHKYVHGHALVLAGHSGHTGAARLAARGALRIGAGLVTVAAPADAMAECAAQLTAVMLRQVDGVDALDDMLRDGRLNAVCLGPGLGVGEGTRALVAVALKDAARSVVLDADALTSFAETPEAFFADLHEGCVLTPHDGEFARLFPDLAEPLGGPATSGPAWSRVDAVRAAADRAGCVVLLKGTETVIAAPGGAAAVHVAAYGRSAPWLSTAGTGDVLAGVIAGLLARGRAPMDAAAEAAWLHVEAARHAGPGLIAEDLPEALPAVLRKVADA